MYGRPPKKEMKKYDYEEVLDENDDHDDEEEDGTESFSRLKMSERNELRAADRLSMRLLSVPDDDSDEEDRILRESFQLGPPRRVSSSAGLATSSSAGRLDGLMEGIKEGDFVEGGVAKKQIGTMIILAVLGIAIVAGAVYVGVEVVGPPSQPVGPYQLIERQEGDEFFSYYTFYEGRDSVGSNGYNMYVGMQRAQELGIVNITFEEDILDAYGSSPTSPHPRSRQLAQEVPKNKGLKGEEEASSIAGGLSAQEDSSQVDTEEPFIYMMSAPTANGPRDSIRLEGNRRFNRGLFIIDIRHLPAGCGVWPAFWLTDEANWPVNGEIDIVEGVNYQSAAKTALHSTKGCSMTDIPLGTMTGTWDTAQGIPDAKTGVPDMTLRYAQNCFVYDPHQWLNQGCVAVNTQNGTLGAPLNKKGGGVFALEWDPINRHIRTWVFTPHSSMPMNLVEAIRTAKFKEEDRIMPDPDTWPIPYGYFAIGDGTDCPASHYRHMRLVFNTAFCGSVAGNRFQLDCPAQAKKFDSCNEWIQSEPEELAEAYWKIRGVYVYERQWERTYLH